jgi:hypothetical protein
MPNPDTTSAASVQSISIAFPTALILCVIILAMFQFQEGIPSFRIVLWVGVLVFSYLLSAILFIGAQFIRCNKIQAGKAFSSSLYVLGTMAMSMIVSSTSWFRVPVASVFAPLFVKDEVDVTLSSNTMNKTQSNSQSKCCGPSKSLEVLEQSYPLLEGISYGFYGFFGMMFGIVLGNGTATTC